MVISGQMVNMPLFWHIILQICGTFVIFCCAWVIIYVNMYYVRVFRPNVYKVRKWRDRSEHT